MKKLIVIALFLNAALLAGRFWQEIGAETVVAQQGGGADHGPLPCQQDHTLWSIDCNDDKTVDMSDAICLLGWLFLGTPEPKRCLFATQGSRGLPATGQTLCYDAAGNVIDCATATCPGQDGLYQTGCPSEGRFVDNGDGTVSDNCTELMWQKNTADVNGDGQLTDQDRVNWCDALAYCETLSFAGHDDWRLPNVRELQSIVYYERFSPTIDPVFGAFCSFYCSSTSAAGLPDLAWSVGFGVGGLGSEARNRVDIYHVRAVRSGP